MYAPAHAAQHRTKLPVFVWLYGGGYIAGDKISKTWATPVGLYNGSLTAQQQGTLVSVGFVLVRQAGVGYRGDSGGSKLSNRCLGFSELLTRPLRELWSARPAAGSPMGTRERPSIRRRPHTSHTGRRIRRQTLLLPHTVLLGYYKLQLVVL